MSENKKIEKEQIVEKKSPNVLVTVLCIVLIIAMFFVGWFAGGKTAELEDKIVDKTTEKKDKKKEEKVEQDVELASLRDDLTNKVKMLERIWYDGDLKLWPDAEERGYREGDIYIKNIESSQISNDIKLYNVLEGLYIEYYGRSPVTTNYNFGSFEVYRDHMVQLDISLVEDEYKKMYGDDSIIHKSFNDQCPMFIYDNVNNKYYGDAQCGGVSGVGILTYVNKVTTMDNDAYVYVSLGSWEVTETWPNNNIYTDYERTKLYKDNVTNYENFINESNYKDFSEYKYTFVNEDGNYIFKSLKRVK